ncbi:MAG: NAD(P)-dependent alcohol dehydrogenase, partial [Verrucomicrobiales bacterium]|nr:NAD(P)-dependent alcohol dehydrogenase [Verrucomicrobiales bacterium]
MQHYLLEPRAGQPFALVLRESDQPAPGPGEVAVKIRATSLNYRDLLVRAGKSASGGSEPVVPLSDGAGEIVALGEGVTDWRSGDRVALTFFRDWLSGPFQMSYHAAARGGSCDGVLSEVVIAPAHSLVAVPATMSFTEAATLPCAALTAWHALMERGRPLAAGETVLCLGTGGVSIFALQIAKAAGARVILTSSSHEKLARARELGADETIHYLETPEWDREVMRITEKRGVDRVVEVGGPGTIECSLNSVAAGGFVSLIGVLTGFDPPQANLFTLVKKNAELQGIYVGHREMFVRMNAFLEQQAIRPVIDRSFPFAEAASAYAHL